MRQRFPLELLRRRAGIIRVLLLALGALLPGSQRADAQGGGALPWTVEIKPTLNPLPIGACGAVWITFNNPSTRDRARNGEGEYLSIADVDLALDAVGVASVVGQYNGPRNWSVCACQSASVGSQAMVTLTYPAKGLREKARVKGVAFQSKASFVIGKAQGTFDAPGCGVPTTTVATTAPTPSAVSPPPAATTSPTSGARSAPAAVPSIAVPEAGGRVAIVPVASPSAGETSALTPVPVNPAGFTAVQSGPAQVQLSWRPVSGTSYYVVFGPGSVNGGMKVSGATTFAATAVPDGIQEFAVASYYEPGPISTPSAQFSRASVNVSVPVVAATAPSTPSGAALAVSGRYLVTMVGLRAYQMSVDDILSRDGMGDEVYAAAYVRRYDRSTGALAEGVIRKTVPYGDVQFFGTQRVQAGTRSGTGGVQDGDPIPIGPLIAFRNLPAQETTFPLRLWEGTLADGADALVITPSIWEQDGSNSYYVQWSQQQQMLNLTLFATAPVQDAITQKRFGALTIGMSGNDANGAGSAFARGFNDMLLTGLGLPIISLLATSADRPLGLLTNGRDVTALPNRTVVLTREIIEAALARPALGLIPSPVPFHPQAIARIGAAAPLPGILMIEFLDDYIPGSLGFPERPALYHMYIQVERVP